MRKLINTFNGQYDFSYLLEKSIALMKNYHTDVYDDQHYDIFVKRIRKDHDSMSAWIGYISDSLLKICDGKTKHEQKIITKKCIINEIEVCLFSQEFLLDLYSKVDIIKKAEAFNMNDNIE